MRLILRTAGQIVMLAVFAVALVFAVGLALAMVTFHGPWGRFS